MLKHSKSAQRMYFSLVFRYFAKHWLDAAWPALLALILCIYVIVYFVYCFLITYNLLP